MKEFAILLIGCITGLGAGVFLTLMYKTVWHPYYQMKSPEEIITDKQMREFAKTWKIVQNHIAALHEAVNGSTEGKS